MLSSTKDCTQIGYPWLVYRRNIRRKTVRSVSAPNVNAQCPSWLIGRERWSYDAKIVKLTVGNLLARNTNEPMVGFGGACILRESGVRRSVFVGSFSRNLASVAVKMFSHLLFKTFINITYLTKWPEALARYHLLCRLICRFKTSLTTLNSYNVLDMFLRKIVIIFSSHLS
jgi:hypothetical protein